MKGVRGEPPDQIHEILPAAMHANSLSACAYKSLLPVSKASLITHSRKQSLHQILQANMLPRAHQFLGLLLMQERKEQARCSLLACKKSAVFDKSTARHSCAPQSKFYIAREAR